MGVKAPMGVTRAYCFAYPIGLFVSFMVYWGLCWKWPVQMQYGLGEWMECKDYVREEERGERRGIGWGSVESNEEGGSGNVNGNGNVNKDKGEKVDAGVREKEKDSEVVEGARYRGVDAEQMGAGA